MHKTLYSTLIFDFKTRKCNNTTIPNKFYTTPRPRNNAGWCKLVLEIPISKWLKRNKNIVFQESRN